MEHVRNFMLQPQIVRYAAEHGSDLENEEFKVDGRQGYLTYKVNGKEVGLIDFHLVTGTMAQFHPYILRKYKEHYDDMNRAFFKWFLKEVPEQIVKLNAYIPTKFKGALAAADRVGMIVEGVDRLSYLSEDGPCDRILVGIIRREMI